MSDGAGIAALSRDTLFERVRILDPASGTDTGRPLGASRPIADFGTGIGRPDGAVSWMARLRALPRPGRHACRLGEPGFEYRETIASAAEAAAAGGITTLAALPDSLPAIDDPVAGAPAASRGEATGSLDHPALWRPHARLPGRGAGELGLLREAGAVAYTDGAARHRQHPADAARAVATRAAFGGRIVQHAEEPSLAEAAAPPRASSRPGSACQAFRWWPRPSWWRATYAWRGSQAARCISPTSPRPRAWS